MKKKLFKQVSAGFLAMVLIAGILPTGLRPLTVHAANGVKTMNLDTSYLAPSDSTWDANDHKVYFGQYGGTPTAFRVLKAADGKLFLDCDTILKTMAFDEDMSSNTDQSGGNPNGWENSALEKCLNGADYYGNTSVFTLGEQRAILQTTLTESGTDYDINGNLYNDYAANDYVYLLSAMEANDLYLDNAARVKTGGNAYWWLRSAFSYISNIAGVVDSDGNIDGRDVSDDYNGVSPALNLDTSKVLFTSVSGVDKSSSFALTTDATDNKNWNLTLAGGTDFAATLTGTSVEQKGEVDVFVNSMGTPGTDVTYTQISAMLVDANNNVLAYGKVGDAATGTVTFNLPDGIGVGNYKLKVFAEDVRSSASGNLTDYASNMVEFGITVEAPVESVFTVSGGMEGTDYTYDATTQTLTVLGGTLTVGSKGAEQGNITITGAATVNLDGTQIGILDVQADATLNLKNASISQHQGVVKIASGKNVNFNTESASKVFAMYCPAFVVESGATLSFSGTNKLEIISWNNEGLISSSGNVEFHSGEYEIGGNSSLPVDGGTVIINGGVLQLRQDFTNSTSTINAGIISTDTGNSYTVYGNQTLPVKLETISEGKSLIVSHNATLTVPDGKVLTNQGMVTVQCGGAIAGTVSGTAAVYENHSYDTQWKSDENGHWYECLLCGDKSAEAAHTFTWITDREASYTEAGSKHEECTVCGYAKEAVEIPKLEEPETPDVVIAPSVTAQPQNISVKVGEKATFSVTASGTAPLTYQWMIDRNDGKGFVAISTATASSYTTSAVDKDCNGFKYKCVVTNTKGSVESNVAVLTVTEETQPEDTEYKITAGGDQTVKENFDGTVTITCNGELSKFVSVSVDGKIVDSKYYSLKSGSTILTFTKDYVNSLSVGKHTIRFNYTDGYVETSLTIKEVQTDNEPSDEADDNQPDNHTPDDNGKDDVPKTGDNTPVAWLFALILISGTGLFITYRKKAVRK